MEFNGKRIHFIGIGGVSMEALSRLCEIDGAVVSGSDSSIPPGHVEANIHKDLDLVIINGAIADDNPEIVRAREFGIPIITRAELLGMIESKYKNRIAVAGTHGKSTTTAMIGAVLVASGLNPTVHNGARPNLVIGGKDFFVTEACEFKRSFLALNPTVAVVTNIDADHLDCYRDIDEIRETFAKFTGKATKVITHDSDDMAVELSIPGAHNVGNAALAVKVGLHFGIPIDTIKAALKAFGGVERRFQTIGKVGSAQVIVDYAHHPTEIETTIQTAQSIYGDKFLVVFQPHTYTRTIALFDDFVATLKKCDCVMYKTFSAREKPMRGGDASDLATTLGVEYFDVKKSLQNYIKKVSKNYKAIILTGAGDINKVLSY